MNPRRRVDSIHAPMPESEAVGTPKPGVAYEEGRMDPTFNETFHDILDQFYNKPSVEILRKIPIDLLNKAFFTDDKLVLMDNIRPVAEYYREQGVPLLDIVHDEYTALSIFMEAADLLDIDRDAYLLKNLGVVDDPFMAEQILEMTDLLSEETRKQAEEAFKEQDLID